MIVFADYEIYRLLTFIKIVHWEF